MKAATKLKYYQWGNWIGRVRYIIQAHVSFLSLFISASNIRWVCNVGVLVFSDAKIETLLFLLNLYINVYMECKWWEVDLSWIK